MLFEILFIAINFFSKLLSACIHMACVVHQKDCKQWFAELNTDLDRLMEITRYILNLYELWKSYDERKEIQALLQKMPKPNTQPVPRWLMHRGLGQVMEERHVSGICSFQYIGLRNKRVVYYFGDVDA